MPDIQAFRGVRYDLGHIGYLSDVVAPPYDVIDPALHDQLDQRHAANVVRLILSREEPADDAANNRYTRAARRLKNWQREGILFTEPDPAVYAYHQKFTHSGQEYTRRGFMARVRLEPFGSGTIYPHEQTHAGPKADRLRLIRSCRANLSQIFGLYPDPENEAQGIVEAAIESMTPVQATDHLGVAHYLWPVTDVAAITALIQAMGPRPIYVADGHHRYETACNYRDELAGRTGGLPAEHPANFVLMMCVGMSDPGMIVLPTHRAFRGLPAVTSGALIDKLGACFRAEVAGEGPAAGPAVWDQIESDGCQGNLGLYCPADKRWVLARLTEAGRAKMADIAPDHSQQWQELGVSILHRLVLENLLAAPDLPRPEYAHLVAELVALLEQDVAESYPLAALVMPATVEHIRQISTNGERMPAKSTYFYPKLLSGLVINPLE